MSSKLFFPEAAKGPFLLYVRLEELIKAFFSQATITLGLI